MTLKALIFDVDGTLAETEAVHLQAFNLAFKDFELGWTWSEQLYLELLKTTGGKERIKAYMRNHLNLDDAALQTQIPQIHKMKTNHYVRLVSQGALKLRPGVQSLIDTALEEELILAIATTTSRANVDALAMAIWGEPAEALFAALACGDEVAHKKPAPDVFLLALERLGLNAADCIAFEDSENGLKSARGAGIKTVAIPSRFSQNNGFKGAAICVPEFTDFALADLD